MERTEPLEFDVWVIIAQTVTRFFAVELESQEDNLVKLVDIDPFHPSGGRIIKLAVAILCQIRNLPWVLGSFIPIDSRFKVNPLKLTCIIVLTVNVEEQWNLCT